MSVIMEKLLSLIESGKTIEEMSAIMNLSFKQIYNLITILQNKGMEFKRKYYEDGTMLYLMKKCLNCKNNRGNGLIEKTIVTSPQSQDFKAVIISDLHIGSTYERPDLLDNIYNFCIKNNYHIILVAGDIIDGITFGLDHLHDNHIDQLEHFLKVYPFDKSILNVAVLGNHDLDPLKKMGLDFLKFLETYRHDFINLGYRQGILNIKNDRIFLFHTLETDSVNLPSFDYENLKKETLVIEGHHHFYSYREFPNYTKICTPPASDISKYSNPNFPSSMLTLELTFNKSGLYNRGVISQYLLEPNIVKINQTDVSLSGGRIKNNAPVMNEESIPGKQKVLKK